MTEVRKWTRVKTSIKRRVSNKRRSPIDAGSLIIIIINKVLIKVTLNKVIAGALYIVICG